jgi:hypothetical protein
MEDIYASTRISIVGNPTLTNLYYQLGNLHCPDCSARTLACKGANIRRNYGMTCLSDCPYGTAIYRSMPWLMAC